MGVVRGQSAQLLLALWTLTFMLVSANGECPTDLGSPRKEVVCYFEGKRPVSALDPCYCTHIVYTNIGLDEFSRVKITSAVKSDLESFKSANPKLALILSLGGTAIKSGVFSSLITSDARFANLTESVGELYQDEVINGIEIDWEWPLQDGDKKDKDRLVQYVRELKIAVEAEVVVTHRSQRTKRSSEDDDEGTTDPSTTPSYTTSSPFPLETTPSETTSSSDDNEQEESNSTTLSPSSANETTEVGDDDDYETTTAQMITTEGPILEDEQALEELQSLVDLILDEEEEDDNQGFQIFLRVATNPEFLVKGYDFEMLNKFVDYYTLPSHNFTIANNATFHHSRLMGMSDIANADSLLDVIVSLGATDSKIILSGSAFGNSFKLLDAENNLPGSSISEIPTALTYQQVCKTLNKGNWTLEREEDRTGPYAYDEKNWIAFDDASSLKIKTKYALLRNLGGVALYSIDADDLDDICGKGPHSLVKAIFKTMSELDRRPRQLIVHSLEEDLFADAQSFIPVTTSGVSVSPFRIVRIVDREGQITSIRKNSETILECTRQGYYRHPEDCSRFYRCVKFNQYEDDYTIFEYGCPNGLVFDDRWEVCVWPSQATPCDGSSEIFPVPARQYSCPAEGYFVDPENCRWFFACLDHRGDGAFTHYEFRCPFGLAFDEELLICNWPWLVPACGGTRSGRQRVIPNKYPASRQQKSFGRGQVGRGKQPGGIGGIRRPSRPDYAASSGAYESSSPARKPINENNRPRQRVPTPGYNPSTTGRYRNPSTSYTTATPIQSSTRRPAYPTASPTSGYYPSSERPSYGSQGSIYGEVVSDSCDNCESPILTINGNGHASGSGIETGYGNRNQYKEERRPKDYNPSTPSYNEFNPSTIGSTYNPSTPRNPSSYNPSTTANYNGDYGPSSTAAYDDYGPSSTPSYEYNPSTTSYVNPSSAGYGSPSTTGYGSNPSTPSYASSAGYPSPSTPAYDGPSTPGYANPSTSSYGNPSSIGGSPSSTSGYGSYNPSPSPSPNYNPSSSGYNYPTPKNPLELPERRPQGGIAVSNPGEKGLLPANYGNGPSSTYSPQPTTPNTTPYSPSSYAPTTPTPSYGPTTTAGYPSTTAYRQPAYQSSTTTRPYQPSEDPGYQASTSKPYQTSRRPAYQSTTSPSYPSPSQQPAYVPSSSRPQYSSSTPQPYYPTPSPQPSYNSGESYKEEEAYKPGPGYQSQPPSEQQPDYQNGGYVYPVPQNPLELPQKLPSVEPYRPAPPGPSTQRNYPSSTAKPVYQSTTPRQHPSSTAKPVYQSTTPRQYPSTTPRQYPSTTPRQYPSTTPRQYPSTTPRQYPSTTPRQYPSTTPREYPSTTPRQYPSTTPRQNPSTTPRPAYPTREQQQASDGNGYSYPVPDNPLSLPERQPKSQQGFSATPSKQDSFRPPQVQYGGFRPPYVPDLPSARPSYQEPNYNDDVVPSDIEYGFKPSYNKDIPSVRPPYYEQGGIAPPHQQPRRPKYNEDREQYRPDYSDQGGSYITTVASAVYDYVSTTIAPYVPGYSQFSSGTRPEGNYKNIPEVASVIPSGFSSATLSNGPHSISNDFGNSRNPRPSQGSSFHTIFGSNQYSQSSDQSRPQNKYPGSAQPENIKDQYQGAPPSSGNYNSQSNPGSNGPWLSFGKNSGKPKSEDTNGFQSSRPTGNNGYSDPRPQTTPRPVTNYNRPQGASTQKNEGYNGRGSPSGNEGIPQQPGTLANAVYNGRPGPNGNEGSAGRPGSNGNGGYNGRPGPNGNEGSDGRPGSNGNGGNNGPPGPNGNEGSAGRPGSNGNGGYNGRPGPNGNEGSAGRPGSNGNGGYNGRPGSNGNEGSDGRPGSNDNGGYNGRPGPNGNEGSAGRPGSNGKGGYNGRPGPNGNEGSAGRPGSNGNGGYNGRPGPNGNEGSEGRPGLNGRPGSNGYGGSERRPGPNGNGGSSGRPGPNANGGSVGRPGPNGNGGYNGRPGPNGNGGSVGRPGPNENGGSSGRPGPNGNGVSSGRPGPNGNGGSSGRPGPNGNGGSSGRPGPNGNGVYNGRPGPNGNGGSVGRPGPNGNGGYNGRPGPNGNGGSEGRPGPNGNGGSDGRPGPNGNGGHTGRPGPNGNGGHTGRPGPNGNGGHTGRPGPNGNGGSVGRPGPNGNGGYNGRPGPNGNGGPGGRPGPNGNGGSAGRPGPNGNGGSAGRPGPNGNGGYNGRPGPSGNGGYNGRPGPNGKGGSSGRPGPNSPSNKYQGQPNRGGRQGSSFNGGQSAFPQTGVTTISRPTKNQPAVLSKFAGTNWDKFGPGGFRKFNDTIGPEVCERPGLFRHPTDCDKFYECYWDKWIDRYTVHIFPCPVVLGYDSAITACNWPFDGPQCQANVK